MRVNRGTKMKCEKCGSGISEWVKIPELNIEIEREPSAEINLIDLKIPDGCRLLSKCRKKDNVNEVFFLLNNSVL